MVTKFIRERRWASASLGCLRGNARKADKSCAKGNIWRIPKDISFGAGLGWREAQHRSTWQIGFLNFCWSNPNLKGMKEKARAMKKIKKVILSN
jgi:hypothetical protein